MHHPEHNNFKCLLIGLIILCLIPIASKIVRESRQRQETFIQPIKSGIHALHQYSTSSTIPCDQIPDVAFKKNAEDLVQKAKSAGFSSFNDEEATLMSLKRAAWARYLSVHLQSVEKYIVSARTSSQSPERQIVSAVRALDFAEEAGMRQGLSSAWKDFDHLAKKACLTFSQYCFQELADYSLTHASNFRSGWLTEKAKESLILAKTYNADVARMENDFPRLRQAAFRHDAELQVATTTRIVSSRAKPADKAIAISDAWETIRRAESEQTPVNDLMSVLAKLDPGF